MTAQWCNAEKTAFWPDAATKLSVLPARRAADYEPIADFEPPAPVPSQVTPRQARLALLAENLLDTVETELAKPENRAAQISWEYATVIERDSDLVTTIGASLGLTEDQIDALFEAAAVL